MKAVITKERDGDSIDSFAVALMESMEFPNDNPVAPEVRLKSVLAANDDEDEWGWVQLSGDEKDCIGIALEDFGAEFGEWYWCQLYREPGELSIDDMQAQSQKLQEEIGCHEETIRGAYLWLKDAPTNGETCVIQSLTFLRDAMHVMGELPTDSVRDER